MIHYMDKTFCSNWKDCMHGETCNRAITPKVEAAATKWWGSPDYPMAVTKFTLCFKPLEDTNETVTGNDGGNVLPEKHT